MLGTGADAVARRAVVSARRRHRAFQRFTRLCGDLPRPMPILKADGIDSTTRVYPGDASRRRGIHSLMAVIPEWIQIVAWVWLAICFASALLILAQTVVKPQKMWIMNLVWPVTALYMGPLAVYLYRKSLPVSIKRPSSPQMDDMMERHKTDPPTWIQNSIAVFHYGASCQ